MTEPGGGRILVVDDDEDIRGALADLLAEKGYEVSLAANGKEALELCHSRPTPDLIFLDLMMPVMGGADFIRVKDADPNLTDVPVCVMTAFAASARIPATSSLVLRKPLGSADIFAVVKRFCRPAAIA